MSRRASFFAKRHPGKRRVRFPDEIVFEESIKESDGEAVLDMLRRSSLDIDVNRINMAGMTALHQAVLDGNLVVMKLLVAHGADINKPDLDSWTPLHAAAANGLTAVSQFLLTHGADRTALTEEGETPEDLADPDDYQMLAILQETVEEIVMERRASKLIQEERKELPAWYRRESLQEDRENLQEERWRGGERKGSAWVSRDDVIAEGEENEDETDDENETDDDNNNEDNSSDTKNRPCGGDNNILDKKEPEIAAAAATDRLQVWRCRRQGRLEQNFELFGNGDDHRHRFPLEPLDTDGGDPGSPSGRISIVVPPRLTSGEKEEGEGHRDGSQ